MRAMPSPTDSTVPTSETCASASKLAIWSRMTREISAARMSIQLAFHRRRETVEFGADRGVDLLAAQLDDDSAEDFGIDGRVDVDVAAGAGAKLGPELCQLIIVQGPCGNDLGGGLAAVFGSETAEGANDRLKLVLAPVCREDPDEIDRD